MSDQKASEPSRIKKLERSVNDLIEEYKQTHSLLNEQMQAVINQDIDSLNELIEKQVTAFEALKKLEAEFKQELQHYHSSNNSEQGLSLSSVLENLERPSQTLNNLRDKLHTQVERTESMRAQLMELLNFAQQHNANTFKAIYTVGKEHTNAYDGKGEKQQQINGLAVNRKA